MSDISMPLFLRSDRPLDEDKLRLLRSLNGALAALACPYMLVGATARDVLLHNVYGQRVIRATQDVDIAVLIDTWEQFQVVKAALLRLPRFEPTNDKPYRLHYKTPEMTYPIPIDILPFGGIAAAGEEFHWPPPDTDLISNVMAFNEAYESSIPVEIEAGFVVQIVSIPGLVILKLLAWNDKSESKQAQDVLRLIETYGLADTEDRLYGEEIDLLTAANFDFAIGAAFLLGKDTRTLASASTAEAIDGLLRNEPRMRTFRTQMLGSRISLDDAMPAPSDSLLDAFVQIFLTGKPS